VITIPIFRKETAVPRPRQLDTTSYWCCEGAIPKNNDAGFVRPLLGSCTEQSRRRPQGASRVTATVHFTDNRGAE